jgi:transposase
MNQSIGCQPLTGKIVWIGADVSKQTFDAALGLLEPATPPEQWRRVRVKRFERTLDGAKACCEWARTQLESDEETIDSQFRVVMEATGKYSQELTLFFLAHDGRTAPAIVNPRLVKAFSDSLNVTNRSDKADARTLARYGVERKPAAYAPLTPKALELREMTRYRQTVVEGLQAEKNRAAESPQSSYVRRAQQRRIRQFTRDLNAVEKKIREHIEKMPDVQRDVRLLDEIYGVGEITAIIIVAELGDLRRFQRGRQLTAFAGMTPTAHDSGTSVHRKSHLSKNGPTHVRRALYLSAISVIQGDNDLAHVYHRLVQQGKKKKVALAAVMRKQLLLMRAVLVFGITYQPHVLKASQTCG